MDDHDLTLPDLYGYYCTVSYGYNTASGNKKSDAAPLWVARDWHTSKMGSLDKYIYMVGAWNILAQMRDIASLLGGTEPPYYEVDYSATSYTIYDIIKQTLNASGFGLYALGGEDDSIMDTLCPDYVVNEVGFENAAEDIYRLLNMTKTFCRVETPEVASSSSSPSSVQEEINHLNFAKNNQRSSFWAVGLYWQFYIDNTPNLVYETSSDGTTWAGSATSLGSVSGEYSGEFSLWYDSDSNYVYIVKVLNRIVYFRRGKCNTDGSITWSAGWQTAFDCGDVYKPRYPNVSVDSNGYPWVTWLDSNPSHCWVSKSNANDGTWSDASGFPYQLTSTAGGWESCIIPLESGRMYALYHNRGVPEDILGQLWDGSSWGSEETIVDGSADHPSAIPLGDDVHIAFRQSAAIKYMKRTYGTGWGSAMTIHDGESVGGTSIAVIDGTQQLVVVCGAEDGAISGTYNKIKYSIYTGSWSTVATLCTDSRIRPLTIHMSTKQFSGKITVSHIRDQGTNDRRIRISTITPSVNASFRIVYPAGYSEYNYTYTSDQTNGDHQFREFDWRDQPRLPTKVYVLANQDADGGWDSVITGIYDYGMANNNEYPEIVEYYVAATITTQADADNRASALATRRHMEQELGRLVVPHNCGQELYDWIKIRDKRGAESYTDYPPARWGNLAVVGSLIHIYDPANGRYDLEITINGIETAPPVGEVMRKTVEEVEAEVEEEVKKKVTEAIPETETVRVAREQGIYPWPGAAGLSRERWIERGLGAYTGEAFQEAIERAGGVEAAREQMAQAVREAGFGHLLDEEEKKKKREERRLKMLRTPKLFD